MSEQPAFHYHSVEEIVETPCYPQQRKPWVWGYLVRRDRILLDLGPITLYFWPRRSQWMRFWERRQAYRLWAQLGPVEIFWR